MMLPLELPHPRIRPAIAGPPHGFHGFLLAAKMAETDDSTGLTAHGTLYKALARMTDTGLLDPAWEDPAIAEAAGRPRRKLYRVTPEGAVALAASQARTTLAPLSTGRTIGGLA